MKNSLCFEKSGGKQWGIWIIIWIFGFAISSLLGGQSLAQTEFELAGRPLTLSGYVNQGVQFGIAGDYYDTMSGFQAALMQALLEVEYLPRDNVKIFITGQFNKDWAYEILDSDDDWKFRRFNQSRSELGLYSDYEDYLKECHVSWSPEGFNLRVGKQIVSWGQMDGVRIMDQINPRDVRRGISDVEFETSIIPIWLAKAEYYPGLKMPGLTDYSLEFTFNPNADFIPEKRFSTGNNVHGIWGVDALREDYGWRIGEQYIYAKKPDNWNSEGYEYGLRLTGTLKDGTYFTLNYFNGLENSPVQKPMAPFITIDNTVHDENGRPIAHPVKGGYYADQEYAGFTFSHDLESAYSKALGGVAPVIRCEALYSFDTTFRTDGGPAGPTEAFEKHDLIYWGLAIDWKFRSTLLNPRRYFTLVPQFSHKYIRDYPSEYKLRGPGDEAMPENQYSMSVRMDTYYMNDKLQPFAYWQRDIKNATQFDMWIFKLIYQPNPSWKYTLALFLLENEGYDTVKSKTFENSGLGNKDNLSFTVQYQF